MTGATAGVHHAISIHVPREGHDGFSALTQGAVNISIHVPREGHDPNDRASARRVHEISIHVPREGHDI